MAETNVEEPNMIHNNPLSDKQNVVSLTYGEHIEHAIDELKNDENMQSHLKQHYSSVIEEVPIIAIQKITPVLKTNPKAIHYVKLKRYNPKLIPVDVYLEKPVEYTTQNLSENITNNISICTLLNNYMGPCKKRSNAKYRVDHKLLKENGITVKIRKLTLDELINETNIEDNENVDRIKATSNLFKAEKSAYNSWLLSLNYHLIDKPDYMKSLPWALEDDGSIKYLPVGTPLPGQIMSEDIANIGSIKLPTYIPPLVTLEHQLKRLTTNNIVNEDKSELP